jgi:hypothetical protein
MKIRLLGFLAVALVGCDGAGSTATIEDGGSPLATGPADAGDRTDSTTACYPDGEAPNPSSPVGARCIPILEEDEQFTNFAFQEVTLETQSKSCASGTCLVNHFQGRVTCPYGQTASGEAPDGSPGCTTPGTCERVTGAVLPQCPGRTAADTVYCSCRCANVNGQTDDGASYCTCPETMSCVQLVSFFAAVDGGPDPTSGAYCVKAGTEYDGSTSCP